MLFFKFPFSENVYTTDENSPGNFVSFFSFDNLEQLDFKGKIKEADFMEFSRMMSSADLQLNEAKYFAEESQTEYEAKLRKVIDFIKENSLSKLVISRIKILKSDSQTPDLATTFQNLTESYPNAFAYVFVKEGKCWIGAFSEVLGKFSKKTSRFETMSLAGTLPVNEFWSEKEREEQKPVSAYIKMVLENYSAHTEISETYDHISGNIKHLRTDFKAKIDQENLEKLISELHPTPAVCGIPKEFCKNAIENFEKYPRGLYAGYIQVETDDYIQYFVNLRCAEIRKSEVLIHVGGGITALSSTEKEWQETELKSEAILKNLAFYR
ncbi:MAG: chorismate-binding protein [Kaistella sp.]|nr:chorismate-binding protein [Kaistella sp.]